MSSSSVAEPSPFVVTSGVLLETSLGAFTVDLYGADCPSATANFINLCRCKFWNGAVATEVIPGVAIFFSHAADAVLDRALVEHAADDARPSNGFWSLLPPSTTETRVRAAALDAAQQRAAVAEFESSKRRACVSLGSASGGPGCTYRPTPREHAPGSLGRRGQLIVEARPHITEPADVSSTQLKFGITLAARNMDFIDGLYMAIGEVSEGQAALEAMRRAPTRAHDRAAGADATEPPSTSRVVQGLPPWPRPLRLLRVKHTTVLPTAGAHAFVAQPRERPLLASQQQLAAELTRAGCFSGWAPPAAVAAANAAIVQAVARAAAVYQYRGPNMSGAPRSAPEPLVLVPASTSTGRDSRSRGGGGEDDVVSLEYNAHYHDGYLSSDDDGEASEEACGGARSADATVRAERRRAALQLHQQKANDTLALMLNLLNGVADESGELKPPENVLFVCKLNPITTGDGLAMCFAQFGAVTSAEVVYSHKNESLCYGFVELATVEACYRAMRKMDGALVDDCRIRVDFSQSVSKLWARRQREMRRRPRDGDRGS